LGCLTNGLPLECILEPMSIRYRAPEIARLAKLSFCNFSGLSDTREA